MLTSNAIFLCTKDRYVHQHINCNGSVNDINENCQRSRFHYYYTRKELENKDTSETASPVSSLVVNLNLTRIVNFQPDTMTKDSTSPLPL